MTDSVFTTGRKHGFSVNVSTVLSTWDVS